MLYGGMFFCTRVSNALRAHPLYKRGRVEKENWQDKKKLPHIFEAASFTSPHHKLM
jgi:hypothetical protein